MGDWIYRKRLALLLTCVAVYYLLQVSNGLWVEDFWDHSAAVSALMRDLLHPRHAQLGVDQPHVFFTPYILMVACAARILGLSSIEALALFGLFNGALLVWGLRRYLRAMGVEDEQGVLFYGILCILFLWGAARWDYSGFFHVGILKFVLANLDTSWIIPTFGAKVIALLHPHAFIDDLDRRRQDLETFFTAGVLKSERDRIIKRYQVLYLLLVKSQDVARHEILWQYLNGGEATVEYEDPAVVLLKLHSEH